MTDAPPDELAASLVARPAQLYAAGLLAVTGAVLLCVLSTVLIRLVPEGQPGWGLLRVSLVCGIVSQTLIVVGATLGIVAVHAAVGGIAPAVVASPGAASTQLPS